ncbi:DUF4429 domain-containing protein [Nonomuraea jiangxiensis]|uniref:Short C-terminal domain-containing protein n=1 Tax=Nonomuraea jiangxiensis TaxID=633440 RepID=A0A1G9ERY6_9ACTN|nr:DUF4429 domain-containing protein [Nonomuraea jiangxiensis]SDK78906.1 Short C-terminal domain-containing protein [Nonomuraea jiangxiensis]
MDELRGHAATWRFDSEKVVIHYDSRWRTHPLLKILAHCEIPVAAIASVDFVAGQKKGWRLRLRLRERADPYAAVGALLPEKGQPFLLTGRPDTELVAEYQADQLRLAVEAAHGSGPLPPAETFALGLVPSLPLHLQTEEGTAVFDGRTVRLGWSDDASVRKIKQRRMEYGLADIRRVDWVPEGPGADNGYLRIVTREVEAGAKPFKPTKDFACLTTESGKEEAWALVMAATVTAHLWVAPDQPVERPQLTAAPQDASPGQTVPGQDGSPGRTVPAQDSATVYDLIRELGRLHAEGLLTDEEFTAKKAELLARL